MNTIQEQWKQFSALVIQNDAPEIQKQEMKLAFYGGAEAVLRLQLNITDPSVSDDAGVQMLEGIHDECRRFAAEIAKGSA